MTAYGSPAASKHVQPDSKAPDQAACEYAQIVCPASPSSRTSSRPDIRANPRPGELACQPRVAGPSGHRCSSLRSASSASKSPPETALNDDRALSLATTMPT